MSHRHGLKHIRGYRFVYLFGLLGVLSLLPIFAQDNNPIDVTALPLGDGKSTTDAPQVGWVYVCRERNGTQGAMRVGEWIDEDAGTYDLTAKAIVDGEVEWPSEFDVVLEGDIRRIVGNGLPSEPTGTYPVARSDDAYTYDPNPNSISAQTVMWELPANPQIADEPACISGWTGILLSGSVLFDGLDARGRDALAHEVQDECQGHPEISGTYHYHGLSACLETEAPDGHSDLYGYALDGFGIYGRYGEDGEILINADLDECHGHTHEIEWDGEVVEMYHYHATWEYPYTVGCFRGRPIQTGGGQPAQGQGGGGQPPQGQQPPPPPNGQGGGQQPPPPPRP